MSDTATGRWEIPGRTTTVPAGRQPYATPTPDPMSTPDPGPSTAPEPPFDPDPTFQRPTPNPEPEPTTKIEKPPAKPSPLSRIPFVRWYRDMKADSAARRARSDAKWVMRWMGEQPTSIRDHVDYLLHERHRRKDGRQGWGSKSEALLINVPHTLFYLLYGLTIALVMTMACYALAWISQRPLRFMLLVAAIIWLIKV